MSKYSNMFLFYFSIVLAILASTLYHFTQKQTPASVNPAVSILVTYIVAGIITLLMFFFFPVREDLFSEIRKLNWASYALAVSIVGIEVGFLLIYRSGWSVGIAAVLVNVAAALALIPVALFFFKDKISLVNILGILVCLVGLIMLNWKR